MGFRYGQAVFILVSAYHVVKILMGNGPIKDLGILGNSLRIEGLGNGDKPVLYAPANQQPRRGDVIPEITRRHKQHVTSFKQMISGPLDVIRRFSMNLNPSLVSQSFCALVKEVHALSPASVVPLMTSRGWLTQHHIGRNSKR